MSALSELIVVFSPAVASQIYLASESIRDNNDSLFQSSQPAILELLAREATRKIHTIFCQLSSVLHNENQTLKTKAGKLESELNTMTKNYEDAKMWRENVLKGCPVLFEESGLVFALKLFGKMMRQTDKLAEGVVGLSLAAGMQSEHGAGMLRFQEKSTCKNIAQHN